MATIWSRVRAVDIDRGPPRHLVSPEEECPNRAGAHVEPPPGALPLALRALAASTSGAALDPGHRDHRHTVLSNGSPNTRVTVRASSARASTS